jgi:hypothetical protein
MADRVPARLTRAQGRRFGLTVGLAFTALAAVSWWRGHALPPIVLGTLGAALVVAGLVVPTFLGPVERAWMALAHALSKVTTPLFMGIVYYGVIAPTGLVMRALGKNPLVHADAEGGYWRRAARAQNMERQF